MADDKSGRTEERRDFFGNPTGVYDRYDGSGNKVGTQETQPGGLFSSFQSRDVIKDNEGKVVGVNEHDGFGKTTHRDVKSGSGSSGVDYGGGHEGSSSFEWSPGSIKAAAILVVLVLVFIFGLYCRPFIIPLSQSTLEPIEGGSSNSSGSLTNQDAVDRTTLHNEPPTVPATLFLGDSLPVAGRATPVKDAVIKGRVFDNALAMGISPIGFDPELVSATYKNTQYARFDAWVGVEHDLRRKDSIVVSFSVIGDDGELLAQTPQIQSGDKAHRFSVLISGHSGVTLKAERHNDKWGIVFWGNPTFSVE